MKDQRPLALVTGGSSGIGFELAKQFAQHGFDVAISGSSDRVHASANALRELGVEAYVHQSDAATYEGVESFWNFVAALGRPLEAAGVTVTALLPGTTDTHFHKNAGMGRSAIDSGPKNDKTLVARQGFDALMNDEDHVVGGDETTKRMVVENRTTPEPVKAVRIAKLTRLN